MCFFASPAVPEKSGDAIVFLVADADGTREPCKLCDLTIVCFTDRELVLTMRTLLLWLLLWPVLLPVALALLLVCFLVNGFEVMRQTLWPDSLG